MSKPSQLARLTTDRVSHPAVRNDVNSDGGIDVKYGVTKSLTADFTYNTDFAQVEADEAAPEQGGDGTGKRRRRRERALAHRGGEEEQRPMALEAQKKRP